MAASSSSSLDTSGNSHPTTNTSFTFSSNPFMATTSSFSDLLSSPPPGDHHRREAGRSVPKFKSVQPPSLPISPPAASPSSYFAIPFGLSPAELLDSPVLLSSSNILPSPTTGTFPAHAFNWKANYGSNQQGVKKEENNIYSDFFFQPPFRPNTTTSSITYQSAQQQVLGPQESARQEGLVSGTNNNNIVKLETASSVQNLSDEVGAIEDRYNWRNQQPAYQSEFESNQQPAYQSVREQRRAEDGYNWRKYGQKQVKGSENPRSYYKCTYPSCPTKKKVEKSLDGQITEIVYKGSHNHPKPQNTRRSSGSSSVVSTQALVNEAQDHSLGNHGSAQMDSVATPENSSVSVGDDEFNSQRSRSAGDEFDEVEPEAKRWKSEGEVGEGLSAPGSRTVREPRVVVQTTSDIDILDDGYRWRKYGQKVVKGNPNPRSYYKCTHPGCPVRKHVERASHDLRAVITTYEGKHNHDVPAARGSGVNRPVTETTTIAANAANIRPATMNQHVVSANSMGNPFTGLEILQNPGSFGFQGFGLDSYMNQQPTNNNGFPRTKEEPRDDMFLDSVLY